RTVPVNDVGRRVLALSDAELTHRVAALLQAHPALLDEQQLPVVVTVPVGARPSLEAPPEDGQILCVHRRGRASDARRDAAGWRLLGATGPDAREGEDACECRNEHESIHCSTSDSGVYR